MTVERDDKNDTTLPQDIPSAHQLIKVLRDQLPWTPRAIYEVGSRIVEGQSQIRALFLGTPKYWGIDFLDGPGVDDLADAVTYETPP